MPDTSDANPHRSPTKLDLARLEIDLRLATRAKAKDESVIELAQTFVATEYGDGDERYTALLSLLRLAYVKGYDDRTRDRGRIYRQFGYKRPQGDI